MNFTSEKNFLPGFSRRTGKTARLGLQLLPAQRAARTFAGRLAFGPHQAAVDKDMLDAGSGDRRPLEGCQVGNGLRVEDGHIGISARGEDAAAGETEPISG